MHRMATDDLTTGDGYAVGSLDLLGEGPGFRKIRSALGVTAFGVNAIVLPRGFTPHRHFHDEQEELYFVHRGRVEMTFGDGDVHVLETGGLARVDPGTVRGFRALGDAEAVLLVVGGKGGYVGRDGRTVEDAA
jgi:quercetin dioxygenase-like cupin family protein